MNRVARYSHGRAALAVLTVPLFAAWRTALGTQGPVEALKGCDACSPNRRACGTPGSPHALCVAAKLAGVLWTAASIALTVFGPVWATLLTDLCVQYMLARMNPMTQSSILGANPHQSLACKLLALPPLPLPPNEHLHTPSVPLPWSAHTPLAHSTAAANSGRHSWTLLCGRKVCEAQHEWCVPASTCCARRTHQPYEPQHPTTLKPQNC